MASAKSVGAKKLFTVDEANRTLPLVKVIVADIVHQFEVVHALQQRLSSLTLERRRSPSDPYSEELAHSQSELQAEETRLRGLVDELTQLGVELKGPDGLCDFPSLRDDREVYLCWRHGEVEVGHWHELDAGVAGRQPLKPSIPVAGRRAH